LNKVTRSSLVTPDSMEKGEEYFRLWTKENLKVK
jgi:hypothetical protein